MVSKAYQVYGIGNALVDIEVEVHPDELTRLGIDKGVMTLVDQKQKESLLEKLQEKKQSLASGGSAANTMIGIARLGGRGFYACRVAKDDAGTFFYKDMHQAGVLTSLDSRELPNSGAMTGRCLVFVTPDADRTMTTCLGVSETFGVKDLDESEILKSEYLYMEGYLVTSKSGKEAAIHARKLAEKNGIKTALTFSDPNMVRYFKDGLIEMMGGKVDTLFCNEDEATAFAGGSDLTAAKEVLKKYSSQFVITLGKRGALGWDGTQFHEIPGFDIKAVDTTGAGDNFAGGFLFGMTEGYSFADSIRIANFAASRVVSTFGPRLTDAQSTEALEFIKSIRK